MTQTTPLKLFNSLTRQTEEFRPVHPGEARVYSCGPTVYNYPHIGNMRAYVFADTLGRVLSFKGYKLTHVINITDVGHLTDDADAGEDKMEKMAAERAQSIWDIAEHYKQAYWADVKALNIRGPMEKGDPSDSNWTIATKYVDEMIEFAKSIAPEHCYELESGLYFDTSTVADYGRLARTTTEEGESRIDPVEGKRHAADFAVWRKETPGEQRQMRWPSPWGWGAPGWHLECSVMSRAKLGMPFDIHTGGIDHREIHHPNEIAQNQAIEHTNGLDCAQNSGARIWMHNNFLVERSGKMSKSSGEFLRLQLLIDRGFHPLAYRLMCLQAHYRSELEFSWEILAATLTRLKRLCMGVAFNQPYPKLGYPPIASQPQRNPELRELLEEFDKAISDDLNTPLALTIFEKTINAPVKGGFDQLNRHWKMDTLKIMDSVLGLGLPGLTRERLKTRPTSALLSDEEVDARLAERANARLRKDFSRADAIRDELNNAGVEIMDGGEPQSDSTRPLRWDWKPVID